jgi:hypothetical protein
VGAPRNLDLRHWRFRGQPDALPRPGRPANSRSWARQRERAGEGERPRAAILNALYAVNGSNLAMGPAHTAR